MEKSSRHGKKKSGSRSSQTNGSIAPYTKSELDLKIAQIHTRLSSYEYNDALQLSKDVVERNPNNCEALEARASVATEMSEFVVALEYLNRAIAAEPFSGYTKFLSKAQICSGKESLECYQKAIEIIKLSISQRDSKENLRNVANTTESMDVDQPSANQPQQDSDDEDNTDEEETKLETELSSVYCSIAELYLTDLCDEPNAEDGCTTTIKNALDTDPSNGEAHITKARYEITVGDIDAAETTMKESRALWLPASDSSSERLQSSTLITGAKALMELEMHDDAEALLICVLEDDDEVVETHYLLGWNCYMRGEEHYAQAKEHLKDAKQVERHSPCGRDQLLAHIDELQEAMGGAGSDDSDDEDIDSDAGEELEQEILARAGEEQQ